MEKEIRAKLLKEGKDCILKVSIPWLLIPLTIHFIYFVDFSL